MVDKHGVFNLQGVSPLDLVEYRQYLQDYGGRQGKGAAPATVNRALMDCNKSKKEITRLVV
ncbi:hypothetical protein JCM14036_02630 [Desulfotomaculum defluvii]